MPLAQAVDSSINSYLSILAPTVSPDISGFRGALSTPTALAPGSGFQGQHQRFLGLPSSSFECVFLQSEIEGKDLRGKVVFAGAHNSPTAQLARPAPSYAKAGPLPNFQSAFAMQNAWPQSLGAPGAFNAASVFPAGVGMGSVGFPQFPRIAQQQQFCQAMLPQFGMQPANLFPHTRSLPPLGQDGFDVQTLMGGVGGMPYQNLFPQVPALSGSFSSALDSRRPQPAASPQLHSRAFNQYPSNPLGVVRPAALHAAFQAPIAVQPQLNGTFGFPAAQYQRTAANALPLPAVNSSAQSLAATPPKASSEALAKQHSRHKPTGQSAYTAHVSDQQPPAGLPRRRRSSVNSGIGVS